MNWEKDFQLGKMEKNPLGILPIPQNVWQKDPKDMHF